MAVVFEYSRNLMKKTGPTARMTSRANMAKLEANAARACNLLKAMANPTRLMVLCQIAEGEKSVGELAQAVGQSQSSLSQHLTVLRHKNLVVARRVGQTVYYSLASEEAASVMETLYELFCRKPAGRASLRLAARPV
jgi:ArsR family transcriptional regulator, virulence genes transcriptional regulator